MGVVLPGAIVLIFLICVGKVREVLREIKLVPGIMIFLGLSVPWYVLAYLRNGDVFISSFFGYHNLERFTQVVNHHQGAWYFHSLIVLIGFFPWSIYLPAAIAHSLRDRSWRHQPRASHLGLFTLIWFAIVLGFFTIAVTKYITYTLPLVPAAAILVSLWWSDQREKPAPGLGVKGECIRQPSSMRDVGGGGVLQSSLAQPRSIDASIRAANARCKTAADWRFDLARRRDRGHVLDSSA